MTPTAALRPCRVTAPAKVNLDLRVLGVRPDGYHDLATVFQSIDLADQLLIEPGSASGFEIRCNDPGVPCDAGNLTWRAAHELARTLGLELPALRVRIDKVIPVQAGLGGGSADAAATLVGVNAMLGSRASPEHLLAVAASLGADVPFMLLGGTALGRGRGDQLRSLPDLPPHDVVVVHPGFGVSTAEAYRWVDEAGRPSVAAVEWPTTSRGWIGALAACANDFERPVGSRHPEIGRLVDALRAGGARLATMTGSGSAVFGLFEPGESATRAARELTAAGWSPTVARTLTKAEFARLTCPRHDPGGGEG